MALEPTLPSRASELDPRRNQVERVIRDPLMRGSEALCQLLRYLADRSLADPDTPVREHHIAADVFGRTSNFDPRTDSTVRVQTGRLRGKLAEYYGTTGKDDPWQIEIPKGSYSAVFHPSTPLQLVSAPAASEPSVPCNWWRFNRAPLGIALALLLVLLAGWAVAVAGSRAGEGSTHPEIAWFWRHLLRGDEPPLVVFSNAEFVGRPETGLRYRKPDEANSAIFDQYTGIGEVFAIHNLDRVFAEVHRSSTLKRGRLLNWDDTENRNLIFVGSPSENLPLRQLPLHRDFTFDRSPSGIRAGDLGIRNLQPQPGERPMYFGSPSLPLTEDYAVIELGWAGFTSQPVLLLAGTTTFGTEAAVEYMTNEAKLHDLHLRLADAANLPAFSFVLHVRIQGGVPLSSSVVAFRRH